MPRGPVFFPPGTSAARRRRRLAFAAVYAAIGACLVWPLYPLAAAVPRPLVLGLPLSLAWVVGALAAGCCALLALYLGDRRDTAR